MNEKSTPNILQRMVAKRDQGGFTLIELLIVIIILAILAAIVVFAVGSTNTNAIASRATPTPRAWRRPSRRTRRRSGTAYPPKCAR